MDLLFHNDNYSVLQVDELREIAARGVRASPLIQRAWRGERQAIEALHIGFWPFVHEFELAIDRKVLPRQPLRKKYGAEALNGRFIALSGEVREMKREEGSHAAHWRKDAQCFGISSLEGPQIPAVDRLVAASYTDDLTRFFAVLAGTELVAEELSAFLLSSPDFAYLSTRKRWVWGVVHTIPHDGGPSHLEIDLDLARAYQAEPSPEAIRDAVMETIALFAAAALEVEQTLLEPEQVLAAE